MSNFRNYINSYVFETELPGSGDTISFRPVTTGQIKKLLLYETSNDSMSIESALDDLIMECVINPDGFEVKKLYIQDRFFLLVEIRKATRGATYGFQSVCTSCSSQSQQTLNLSNLPVTKLNTLSKAIVSEPEKKSVVQTKQRKGKLIEKSDEIKESNIVTTNVEKKVDWNVVKINDNISVRLSLITRDMQDTAYNIFTEKYKNAEISDLERTLTITTTLYGLSIIGIITPEGEETDLPLEERIFFLDNIQQSEQDKISGWFDTNDFGIDFSFDVVCSHCGYKERKEVPVENFFY